MIALQNTMPLKWKQTSADVSGRISETEPHTHAGEQPCENGARDCVTTYKPSNAREDLKLEEARQDSSWETPARGVALPP